MSKARDKVLRKAQLLRLSVDELCDNIEARESRESCLGTYPPSAAASRMDRERLRY